MFKIIFLFLLIISNAISEIKLYSDKTMLSVRIIGDKRENFSKNSPKFLEAYGKLNILKKDYNSEDCTGTLVQLETKKTNSLVITSAHCMKNINYKNSNIRFKKRDGSIEKRSFSLIYKDDDSDYAFLKLNKGINSISPLTVKNSDVLSEYKVYHEKYSIVAAGYSMDRPNILSYDNNCKIIKENPYCLLTNCIIYPGGSGGGLLVKDEDNEEFIIAINRGVYHNDPQQLTTVKSNKFIYKLEEIIDNDLNHK